ncbi:hypothetical protein [Streptomyces sp. NPDC059708]|uniref:hypothetical protein n=1 Tax=Streptomyces sp. NPDC059708 TaxID=3346916 RepID=UPI0036C2CCD4
MTVVGESVAMPPVTTVDAAPAPGLVQVFATAPATVARVVPLDDLGAVAAALNVLDRGQTDVVYVDRWAAAVRTGRARA